MWYTTADARRDAEKQSARRETEMDVVDFAMKTPVEDMNQHQMALSIGALRQHIASLSRGFEEESSDVDRLLEKLGLARSTCRSEGGRILVAKVANILRDQMAPGSGG